jgi:Domain of unknown function (DUF6916)
MRRIKEGRMYSFPDIGPLLTAADFEPHVGEDFLVDASPKPLRIRLEKVMLRPIDPQMRRQPFMLIFTTPWTDLLLAAMYRMQPSGGRQVELFLSPTQTAPGERRYYHAVFN